MKTCVKCGDEHPATTEFWHKASSNRDGLNKMCKGCRSSQYKKGDNDDEDCIPAPVKITVDCMNKYAGCNHKAFDYVAPDFKGKLRKQCEYCNENGHPDTRDIFGIEEMNKKLTKRLKETGVAGDNFLFGKNK